MPEHDTGMTDPSGAGSPQIEAAERRGEPLTEWQDSLKAVQGAAEASMAELASLGRDLAAAVRSMRRAEAWDPERTEEDVSALAAHLERVQERLAGRVDILKRSVEGASAAAASSMRRLGRTYQRVREEREASQDLYGRLVAPLTERLLALEAAMTELRSSLSSGLVDSAWIGSVRERLSGVERAIARLADRDPDQDALVDLRQAMADIRLDLKEAAGPSQEAIAAMQGSLADLATRIRELPIGTDRPTGDPEARLNEMQAALEANLERLAARLTRRLKTLEGPEGPTSAEREVAATNKALRKEVEAFRKRIEGWGKPRTAPRLAEEVQDLEQRFGEMQRAVEQTIAGEVAKRVRASVDRRVRDIVGDLPDRVRQTALKTVRESIREEVEGATGEAVREAMRELFRETADEVVREAAQGAAREAADEAVRDALRQPASPPGPLNEPEPLPGPRRRFGRRS